jgi:2-keto-4-pentenoate hydratase/2-oxohepta-3-ene-1,7-dioic acid hydratase in catechol pathway
MRDLSGHVRDIDGAILGPDGLSELAAIEPSTLPKIPEGTRLGPPVSNVSKIVAIGLNYSDHAREAGMPMPDEPIVFMKAPSSICGPFDKVILPRGSEKSDWEVELGVVIGTRAQYVNPSDAIRYIAGYCVANDISERHFQLERSGQWVKGKSADTFCPFGPWLTTKDEVPDPQYLAIWLELDGNRYQDGNTSTMIFPVTQIVGYLSQFMTLLPGDLILTGTPPGVGFGMKPPIMLKPGNVMRLGIEGLGVIEQEVVAWPD